MPTEKTGLNVPAIIVLVAVGMGFLLTQAGYLNISDCADCDSGAIYDTNGNIIGGSEGVKSSSGNLFLISSLGSTIYNGDVVAFTYTLSAGDKDYDRLVSEIQSGKKKQSSFITFSDPAGKQIAYKSNVALSKGVTLGKTSYTTGQLTFNVPSSPTGTYTIRVGIYDANGQVENVDSRTFTATAKPADSPSASEQQAICDAKDRQYCDADKLVKLDYYAVTSGCAVRTTYSDSLTCSNKYYSDKCSAQGGSWTGSTCQMPVTEEPVVIQPPVNQTPTVVVDGQTYTPEQVSPSLLQKYGFITLFVVLVGLEVAVAIFILRRRKR